ncbi:hypothetical protein WMF37_40135 [Sorangium sp. So ce291]|uniref:hypothetical protein n=1 Tax=Sorangium sp. So ce291 TaxID=3133294 RepID=UPI003F5FEA99
MRARIIAAGAELLAEGGRDALTTRAVRRRRGPITGRPGAAEAAIALRASLDDAAALTPGERHLLIELLDRLASSGP